MVERQTLDISTSSVLKALLLVLLFILLYLLTNVIIILMFAIVIASAVSPFVAWFEKRKVPRLVGALLLYLLVFALVVIVSYLVIPSVTSDVSQLTSYLPKIAQQVSTSLDTAQQTAPKYFDFVNEIQNILEVLSGYLQQFSQSALNLVATAFGGVFSFLAVVVMSFYLVVMRRGIEGFLEAVVPERFERYAVDLWKRSENKVGLWLQGQMLLSLIIGLVVFVGLSLMGVRFALILGILAMLLEIVPIAGPVLAAIPAIGIALLQQPSLALWVLVFYVVVQQLEGHILVPLIMGKSVGLNPVIVIVALLVGGQLAGIAGMLLGIPVATIFVEILDDMARVKSSRTQNT